MNNYRQQPARVKTIRDVRYEGRTATPAVLRNTLVDYHNRNLQMVPTKELQQLQQRLTSNEAGGDARTRILLANATAELNRR
ncbi:hypothetical protein LJ737_20895 [Hymenobacter sp. 15J16-1T3B]|uniref:hypothetical protein n=1 Tax=Hymenobacter sp. 15J16-1T3B TaxID=2886941 RepID=UPI001D0FAFD6|nr:hypothetical protein [Hymenobacter sp. 15J16-1T3B]MCC3159712.1 hypothetical protein [Hymenobacter sp. 15J16-1T3B]